MKYLGIVAAGMLAISPAIAMAQGTTSSPSGIEPGGTSQGELEEFTIGTIPFEAYVAGGFVLLGGAVIGILIGGDDSDGPGPAVTTSTP